MLAELVFVTRLLGLMSGTRAVDARVDPSVSSVEILLDGKSADLLRGAPWRTKIDFGPELAPHELTAVARDAEGRELARDTQFINVPRPEAEIGVMFQRNRAEITWQHIAGARPKAMKVKLGDKVLASVLTRSVTLPPLPPEALNVLSVDLEFEDGSMSHRDVVFGGFSEEMPAELTATIVRERGKGEANPAKCFRSGGKDVAASAVELGDAAVLVVRSSYPPVQLQREQVLKKSVPEPTFAVPRASLRFIWPVASGAGSADLFATSDVFPAMRGVRWTLTRVTGPQTGAPPRLADAVAVAGTEALREHRRRAVVLIVAGEEDASRYQPAVVRRYLERIGVDLHVWTVDAGKLNPAWGEAEEIGTAESLNRAVTRLRRDLDRQRIAWLPITPYEALHVETTAECAWEPAAR
jgi:hypothetical protein